MGIKRYYASKDNTLTNAFKSDLLTRGTGSNMGASDILEAFVIHGQTSGAINATNAEQSRILISFPVVDMVSDITAGTIPSSSVEYRLIMTNAPHGDTTPLGYELEVTMISGADWQEGTGLDMEEYKDLGVSNWLSSSDGTWWLGTPRVAQTEPNPGGAYFTGTLTPAISGNFYFSGGLENLDLDVTFAVDQWRRLAAGAENYGLLIKHPNDIISGSSGSFFTKRFFGRTSDYFFNRPYIEARWDSSRKDQRESFFISSSLAQAQDNLNRIFMYNNIRGQLKTIPNTTGSGQHILVSIYSGSSEGTPSGSKLHVIDSEGNTVLNVTGGLLVAGGTNITGVYSCSFATTSTHTTLHDVWHSSSVEFFTGTISPQNITASGYFPEEEFITDVTNLQSEYRKGRKPIFRVHVRKKNWMPNVYTVVNSDVETEIIEDGYWRLYRKVDGLDIIPYGTGTYKHTKMSFDASGNYFELDTTILEPGYVYGMKFLYYLQGKYKQQPEEFKFRITEEAP